MYSHVIWPERYDPRISAIYALNDIDVKAPAEVVWTLLIDAENWLNYFPPEDQDQDPLRRIGTRTGHPIQPGDSGLSDEPCRHRVRAPSEVGMGDHRRRRPDRFERLSRLAYHPDR